MDEAFRSWLAGSAPASLKGSLTLRQATPRRKTCRFRVGCRFIPNLGRELLAAAPARKLPTHSLMQSGAWESGRSLFYVMSALSPNIARRCAATRGKDHDQGQDRGACSPRDSFAAARAAACL